MVVAFAVGAAIVNALMSLLQRLGVEGAPRGDGARSSGVLAHAIRRPEWIVGFVGMGGSFALQSLALHTGSLAVVQPLLATELFFVVLILRGWYGIAVTTSDWVRCALAVGGLSVFLAVLAPTNSGHLPSNGLWLAAGLATIAAALVLVALSRTGAPWWRALVLGAAASIGFALTAALTKAFSEAFSQGLGHVFSTWPTYALVVTGLGSFVLMQHAFHAGPWTASQSTLILVNPFVSVALGALLYGESFPHGALALTVGLLGVVTFAVGSIGLCMSPLIAGMHDDDVQLLAGRGLVARRRAAASHP